MSFPVLSCENLSKTYAVEPVINGLTLALPAGKIVGLLGPNGSGKTTLLKLFAGLLTPSGGSITVCGTPVGAASRALVSYLPDRCVLPLDKTAAELVRFYEKMFSDFDAQKAKDALLSLKIHTGKKLRLLSKGTREKIHLILTMSRRARLYLLDEPIGGVDPATRDFILHTILDSHAPESTVLISTHLISDIEKHLDSFYFIREGSIVADGDADAYREENGVTLDEAFRRMFQC